MVNEARDYIIYHTCETLVAALAEAEASEKLVRHLRARSRLRLITMSEEELQTLAQLTASPPDRTVETAYRGLLEEISGLKRTSAEWMKDLQRGVDLGPEKKSDMVLIVENDSSLRAKLLSIFKQAGFAVAEAGDYSQALKKLRQFRIDVVVMDSILPDRDGFGACSELRSNFKVPVILLGQDTGDELWARVMESEAEHYEIKSSSYVVLVARTKAILRRYKPAVSGNGDRPCPQRRPKPNGFDFSHFSVSDVGNSFPVTEEAVKVLTKLIKQGEQKSLVM